MQCWTQRCCGLTQQTQGLLFLLNWRDHAGCHNLKQLCRSLCHMARVHRTSDSDAIGEACSQQVESWWISAMLLFIRPWVVLSSQWFTRKWAGRLCARWERKLACYSNAPFFSIAVLSDTGLVPEQMTWSELGCPRCVSIVSKQVTRHQTEDFFEAIEAGDAEGVRALLLDGQDPSCMIVETALNIAVVRGHKEIVGVLLRGGAAVNLIPPGVPHAPLHHAVIFGSIRICQQLLQRRLIQAFRIEEAAGPFTTPYPELRHLLLPK